jgi:tetraacyldisaccharide 4'-kinase
MVLVTRKTADPGRAAEVLQSAAAVGEIPGGVVGLAIDGLVPVGGGEPLPASRLAGARVTLLTGVAEPDLVAAQLRALGADVVLHAYPDHHAFRDAELAAAAAVAGQDFVVCTLKDAVKIAHRWPGARPLWYVSQRLTVERGDDELTRVLDGVLATITVNPQTAG